MKKSMPAAEFVRLWTLAKSLTEFCEATGLSKNTASARASYLRRRGVNLKHFTGHGPQRDLDIKKLNQIIKETQ